MHVGGVLRGLSAGPGRRAFSAVVLTAAAAVLATMAYLWQGYAQAEVSLNDGGVWVTNRDFGLVGRFNRPVEQLDAQLSPTPDAQPDVDVLQDADTVFVHDRSGSTLRRMDVALVDLGLESLDLPAGAEVALGGGAVAILVPDTGKVWVRPIDSVLSLNVAKDPPAAEAGGGAALAMSADGTAFVVSAATDTLVTVTGGAGGSATASKRALGVDVSTATVTAVGDSPVVLGAGGRLVLPGGQATLPPQYQAGAVLQQPGPQADTVLVAADQGLVAVDLSSRDVAVISDLGGGDAAAPVRLGSCVHAAWAKRPTYLRRCDGIAAEEPKQLTDATPGSALAFRVNRQMIVLNELASGKIFVYERGGKDLGNWKDLLPPVNRDKDDKSEKKPDVTKKNHPPVARPDRFGARPGQAATLTVLDNDGDIDGDVLIIRAVAKIPGEAGQLSIVGNGQALQFVATPGWDKPVRFKYTIDDGRGGVASADVTVSVRTSRQNSPPYLLKRKPGSGQEVTVGQGGVANREVLKDWRDPDGDPLVLASAEVGAPDAVRFTAVGEVTYADAGTSNGRKSVALTVTDGRASTEGQLPVRVLPATTNGPPRAMDDRVATVAGLRATLRPLDNDSDPESGVPGSGSRLRVTWVSQAPANTSVILNDKNGTIAFTAARPGTYYLRYEITDGEHTARARIRVDARAPSSANPPVAVTDSAVLRGGSPVSVDVLANDIDLDGDVLVVQSVDVPGNSGITVSVVGLRWLRIASSQAGDGTVAVRYVVSDGGNTDEGVVQVSRLSATSDNQAPTAVDDATVVRAGGVVTLRPMANDSDPEGEPVTLDRTVVPDGSSSGTWTVVGDAVRFAAPDRPGTATASYTIRDPEGRSAVAQLSVTVIAADAAQNQPPRPATVQARVFAGATVRIPIPVEGSDPDGDAVTLLGPIEAPHFGRIIAQGPDYLDYQAYAGMAGTDEFSYRVRDGYSARGTGTVRVGVVARPERDSAPVAVDDSYTVAPGTTIRVPVLANDSDADGDALTVEPLAPLNPNLPAGVSLEAGQRVAVTAGDDDGDVVHVTYGISDGRGQRASATITVTAEDGANLAPVARDDLVTDVPAGASAVEVDVLANDDDLDGSRAALELEPLDAGNGPASTVTPARLLRVGLTDAPRMVAYRITDERGGTATAFVRVPAAGNQPPVRVKDAPELRVNAGGELTVDLATQVSDPEGKPVRLTTGAAMSTSPVPGLTLDPGRTTATSFTLVAATAPTGPAMVVIEVTDAATADDPAGRVATISLPVTIVPPAGQDPTFACPPAEPQAGAPAVIVDLATCVPTPDRKARAGLTFADVSGVPSGVQAQLDGTRLRVTADETAAVDKPAALTLKVTDVNNRSADGELGIVVRPAALAMAMTDTVDGLRAGAQTTVDVTANDVNPFPAKPLTVTAVGTGPGVTARVAGNQVVIKANGDFFGRSALTYQVQDATGDPARVVGGQIVVNVVGKPGVPARPAARSTGDGVAVLTWLEPDANGAAITGYDVMGEGGFKQRCANTVCQLKGLRNGSRYHFQVRACNVVGCGGYSAPSAEVRPDVRPDQPAAPRTKFGDGSVTLTWSAPTSRGSKIEGYELEVSPPVGGARRVTGTTYTWTGLTNGVAYTFRVRAYNASPTPSEWSPDSAPETPAKAPDPPAAPTAAGVVAGIGKQMNVQWAPPNTNGAPISGYELTVVRAGAAERTVAVDGDTTPATVDVDNGVNYTFRVVAINKAGKSAPSADSAATVAHGRPFQVTSFSVVDNNGGTGYDRRVRYALNPPNDNGMASARYEFNYSGGDVVNYAAAATGGFVPNLTNGTAYRLKVRACNDMCGEWSAQSAAVTPYGPVNTPGAGAAKNGARHVTVSWSQPAANGRPIARLEISLNGGGWENVGTGNGNRTVGDGPNQTWQIRVRAIDSAGQVSAIASAQAATDPPQVNVSKGARTSASDCTTSACALIVIELVNFPANTTVSCSFKSSHSGDVFSNGSYRTNGDGYYRGQTTKYFGWPGGYVEVTCNGVTGRSPAW